jgi:glycosyltransferase involved in cell wall biosynthesis
MEAKISVIVPIYNVEEYLGKCIESILAQTVKGLELILINDGSRDSSGDICDKYRLLDDRVIVIHQENQGVSCARNNGLEVAKGEFIGFVDGDDWIDEDMYQILLEGFEQAGVDIVQCGIKKIYDDRIETARNEKRLVLSNEDALCMHIQDKQYSPSVWNKLFRHEVIRGIRFQAGKIHEDYYFEYRTLLKADTVVLLDACKYNHIYTNDNSITSSAFNSKDLHKVEAFEERMEFLNHHTNQVLAEEAEKAYYKLTMDCYYRCVNSGMQDGAEKLKTVIFNNRKSVTGLQRTLLEKLRVQLFLLHPQLHNHMLKAYHQMKGIS